MSNQSKLTAPAEANVTIRFPQVDAAKIIFYPRVFELLFRHFPGLPLATLPCAFQLEFLKPNRLGDEIRIVFDRDEVAEMWSFSARMDGVDHFVIRSLDAGDADLLLDAHRPDDAAFKTDADEVGEWTSDRSGYMHLSRYFEYLNVAVEEWFEDVLESSFREFHLGQKVGIPTVRFETRCRELPRAGDTISQWLRLKDLGNRSMTFTNWLVRDGECLIETEQTIVFVRLLPDDIESIPIPGDIRAAFSARLGS